MITQHSRFVQLLTTVSISTAIFFSGTSLAAEPTWFGQTADGSWLVGADFGAAQIGRTGHRDTGNAGVTVGYEFSRPIGFSGTSTIEFSATTSTTDGNIGFDSIYGATGNWDVDTQSLFFTYRTPGTVYFKGKLGGIQSSIRSRGTTFNIKEDDTSLGFGAGLGLRPWKNVTFEAEYAGASGSNDISLITIGAKIGF